MSEHDAEHTEPAIAAARRSPATLVDVAARAGVSLKTASRAVNGEPHVAEATRMRVAEAASALGFQLNSAASMLKRGIRSNFIGFITGDLANPFYSALAKGIERELRNEGLQLTIGSTDENAERESALFDELVARQVRAIIVVSTRESHADLASAQEHGIPVVFVDRAAVGLVADSVLVDNRSGARAATEHLLARGHERIGFIGDFSRLPTHRDRLSGFLDALTAAGIRDARRFVREGSHDAESARRTAEELLSAPDGPTALFTSNNRVTIGALSAFRGRAVSPALIGFDDFDLADVLGVTVVAHDTVEMGRRAARIVLDTLESGETLGQSVVLPAHIIERGSGEVAPGETWR